MKILFLCVANSARSQLAEAAAKLILPQYSSNCEVWSAGSEPSGIVHPQAKALLKSKNIDSDSLFSKGILDIPGKVLNQLDYIITLCEEEVCPTIPGSIAQKLHWGMPDPANSAMNQTEIEHAFANTYALLEEKLTKFAKKIQ
jgi:arsenate reductase (thioredoxin)